MANFDNLIIFRKTESLVLKLIDVVNDMPKMYKYSLGDKLINKSILLLELIMNANSDINNRVELLDRFLNELKMEKVILRIITEKKMINLKSVGKITLLCEDILKQCKGWRNKTIEKEMEISN